MKRTSIITGLLIAALAAGNALATTPQQACDASKNEIGNKENQQKDVENQVKDINNQIDAKKQEIKALEDRKQTKKDEIKTVSDENRKKDIENQIKDIDNQIDSVKQAIVALEDRKKTKTDEITIIKDAIKKATAESQKVCTAVVKCEAKKEKKDGFKQELTTIEQSAAALKKEVAAKETAASGLKKKSVAQKTSYEKINCAKLSIDTAKQEDVDQCNQIVEDAKADRKTAIEMKKEVTTLKKEIKKLEAKEKRTLTRVTNWSNSVEQVCAGDPVVEEAKELTKKDAGVEELVKKAVQIEEDVDEIRKTPIPKPIEKKSTAK
ncbi:MAG: hypothetical protein JXX29_03240 [Deltaproteobacteria bacterium]|nr:hypothetical protein [Deltaproteobacteria bacterium]MBN2670656.1 hypothetical protein [Deltaproteobacteria bacterium]